MAIIDCFSYNGEADILEIRLNILNDFVDQFIICEAPLTFTGKSKPLYFEQQKERFKQFLPKIKYFVIDENDDALWEMARNSPNTQGAEHWKREFVQKESIKKALTHLKNDDLCFIGDVDEIPEPIHYTGHEGGIVKLKLRVYAYYLNNRSDEVFWGTIKGFYKDIKNECLNHLRTNNERRCTTLENGWHFTSIGGLDEVRRKLNASYTQESYNTAEIQQKLQERFENNKDYIGRGFVFTKDESHLPKYILNNKEKYGKLFR